MRTTITRLFRCLMVMGVAVLTPMQAQADIFKWVRNEALPTVKGQRPIVIRDYVSIRSGSTRIQLGQDSMMIRVGSVTVQTGKLRLRLAQAGCIYATGGDVMTCAPDVVEREAGKLFDEAANGAESNRRAPKPPRPLPPLPPNPCPSCAPNDGLKFEDLNGRTVAWEPPEASVGFDFSNPGSAPTGKPAPSAFLHAFAVARGRDESNQATVRIVGRADFAFMDGQMGGVLCLFANEKGVYLHDRNGQYRDQYGLVAIGDSSVITKSPSLVQIDLTMPWSELELGDDADPYLDKFVKCQITVDDVRMSETEWAPF